MNSNKDKIYLKYEDLIKKYDEVLVSTSRGFDTNHEFLEAWVPNFDITISISDLINAAIDYDVNELEVEFSKDKIQDLNFEKLNKKFSQHGNVALKDNKLFFSKVK